MVGALVGLAVWQLVSRAWAVAPDATILEAERTLLYAGAAASAFLAVTRDRAEELVLGVLVGASLVTLGGLGEHVLGSETAGRPAGAARRLCQCDGHPRRDDARSSVSGSPATGRGGAAGLPLQPRPPAAAALYLSLSRGSVLAAALGLLVLVLTARSAAGVARLGVVAVPAVVAVVARRPGRAFPRLGSDRRRGGLTADARRSRAGRGADRSEAPARVPPARLQAHGDHVGGRGRRARRGRRHRGRDARGTAAVARRQRASRARPTGFSRRRRASVRTTGTSPRRWPVTLRSWGRGRAGSSARGFVSDPRSSTSATHTISISRRSPSSASSASFCS